MRESHAEVGMLRKHCVHLRVLPFFHLLRKPGGGVPVIINTGLMFQHGRKLYVMLVFLKHAASRMNFRPGDMID